MTRLFFFPRPCPSLLTEIILCQVLITDVAVEPGSGSQAGHSIILALFHRCCSVAKLCLTLCEPLDCSTLGFPVLHYLPEFAQIHIHWVSDAIQSSRPLLPSSPPALNLSQHQGLFQWADSSHQVAKVLELRLQHQSFQWIFRVILMELEHLLVYGGFQEMIGCI